MLKTVDPRQESTSLMGWAKQATRTVYNFGMDKKCSEFYTLNAHPVRFVTAVPLPSLNLGQCCSLRIRSDKRRGRERLFLVNSAFKNLS